VLGLLDRLPEHRAAARAQSIRFDSEKWIDRHREMFFNLIS
jgi:hypothetical protein